MFSSHIRNGLIMFDAISAYQHEVPFGNNYTISHWPSLATPFPAFLTTHSLPI